jgi:hypothetical protein
MANNQNLRPPKFGEVRNPHGRPKGARNLSTVLREMLDTKIDVDMPDGTKSKKDFRDIIIQKLIKKASTGDLKAIDMIMDRTDGKPCQAVDVTSLGEKITNVPTFTVVDEQLKNDIINVWDKKANA